MLYEIVLIDEYFGVYVVVGFDVYCMDVLFDLIEIVWDMLLFVLVDWVLWCCVVGWEVWFECVVFCYYDDEYYVL